MDGLNIDEIIERTVNRTVLKLKMTGLIKDHEKPATAKTEVLLLNYRIFKSSDQPYTRRITGKVETALNGIRSDPYYSIIPMFYFDGISREEIADSFGVTPTTISRNKSRLLQRLTTELFSDDVITEIFL